MFSHIYLGITDFDRALAFYDPVMASLGIESRFCDRERPWAGWQSAPGPRPLFVIGKPFDDRRHEPGNGQMVAFVAESRAAVDETYAAALANGGTSEGAPGSGPSITSTTMAPTSGIRMETSFVLPVTCRPTECLALGALARMHP